jgi:hypothetical protein
MRVISSVSLCASTVLYTALQIMGVYVKSSLLTPPHIHLIRGAGIIVARLRDEPFQDALVAKYELTQILDHAWSLSSEILHRLGNQIYIIIIDPSVAVRGRMLRTMRCFAFGSLAL